jgi:hypothetical protein
VTPLTVTWLWPAVIVPVTVPPRVPVPVARESESPVEPATAAALPYASWLLTTTGNAAPAIGLAPPFTEVIASFEAAAGATVNARPAPFVRVPSDTVIDVDSAL